MTDKIVKITWMDTCFYPDHTGKVDEIMEKAKTRIVIDVGYLIGQTDEKYVIATAKKEGGRYNKITAIPTAMVKEVIEIK